MPYVTQINAINDSTAEIYINDLGISIDYASQRDLFKEFRIEELHESEDLKDHILTGDIIINDGIGNLVIDDAIAHVSLESEYSDREYSEGVDLVIQDNGIPLTENTVILNFIGAGAISYDATTGSVNVNVSTLEFIITQNNSIIDVNAITPNVIPWELEVYKDTSFTHSNTVNPSRIYISRSGTYEIRAQINLINTVATHGVVRFRVRVNNTEYLDYTTSYIYARKKGSAEQSTGHLNVVRNLIAGDFVEIVSDRVGFTGIVNTIPLESTMTVSFLRAV